MSVKWERWGSPCLFSVGFFLNSLSKKNTLHLIDKYLKKTISLIPRLSKNNLAELTSLLAIFIWKFLGDLLMEPLFLKLEKLITKNHQEMKVFLEILLDQKILILVTIRSDVGDYRKINEFTKDDKLNEFKNRI